MRTKLPFLMLALLPFASFAQNAKSKVSVHPVTKQVTATKAVATTFLPTAYCMPVLDCTDGDLITNVTFAGINNTTTCSPSGYGDFTAISSTTPLLAGSSYPISVTVFNGSWPYEDVAVWIDYNNNDAFDASEYTYIGNKFVSGVTLTGNITIPAGTANGNYKMRVRVAADGPNSILNTMACDEEQGYGETEDYTLAIGVAAPQGCLTSPNGVWPTANYTPACNGAAVAISPLCYAGEYSNVNVTAGVAYTFSTSIATYFVTIADSTGATVLASGVGTATYTPTASGVVRFYSHTNNTCGSGGSETTHSRLVKCGNPPTNCADFKVLSNNLENGGFLGGTTAQRLAIDLPVAGSSITAYGIEPTVIGAATTFSFVIYSDNAGLPGTQLATRTGTIVGSVITGNAFTYDFYKYTVKFDSPYTFAANTKYWIETVSDAVGWESTSAAGLGSRDAFLNSGTSGAWVVGTSDYVFNLVCYDLAVSDVSNTKVSFYPNPVKDVLTINSKNKIEAVHIYNVAGQKMPVSSKIVDGKIDMSKFAPGVYIVSTILEGGVNESFKVVKK